jgi:hypothetical protein
LETTGYPLYNCAGAGWWNYMAGINTDQRHSLGSDLFVNGLLLPEMPIVIEVPTSPRPDALGRAPSGARPHRAGQRRRPAGDPGGDSGRLIRTTSSPSRTTRGGLFSCAPGPGSCSYEAEAVAPVGAKLTIASDQGGTPASH